MFSDQLVCDVSEHLTGLSWYYTYLSLTVAITFFYLACLDELQGSAVSLTRTASMKETTCSDEHATPCNNAVDGIADGTDSHQWKTAAHHNSGHWFSIAFEKAFRVNKIRFKQLSTDFKQIKDININFFSPDSRSVQVGFFSHLLPLSVLLSGRYQCPVLVDFIGQSYCLCLNYHTCHVLGFFFYFCSCITILT